MSVVTPTREDGQGGTYIVTWADIGDSDTCAPYSIPGARDRTVQISGTFNSATIVIQGTVDSDGTNGVYATLTDPQGNAISKTSAAIEAITENTTWTKPATSGGSSSSVTVKILYGSTMR